MLPPAMSFFDHLERRAGWLAFPGFLRFYALFHVLVFVLQFIRPDLPDVLAFDRGKIMSGEVWRIATMFFANSEFGRPGLMGILFLAFMVGFVFMVSDGLENAWGTFKASLFYYAGIVLALIANFLFTVPMGLSGLALYSSAFLAFATLFPKTEILFMMIIPVQVRLLALLLVVSLISYVIGEPGSLPFVMISLLNYAIWAGIPTLRGTALVIESAQRRQRFNARKLPGSNAFHTCRVCERTEISDPTLEFRIGSDGSEYCSEHLPK